MIVPWPQSRFGISHLPIDSLSALGFGRWCGGFLGAVCIAHHKPVPNQGIEIRDLTTREVNILHHERVNSRTSKYLAVFTSPTVFTNGVGSREGVGATVEMLIAVSQKSRGRCSSAEILNGSFSLIVRIDATITIWPLCLQHTSLEYTIEGTRECCGVCLRRLWENTCDSLHG